MSAGAPVPAALLRRLTAVLPNAALHTPYGMTEALPVTDISLPEIEAAGDGRRGLRRPAAAPGSSCGSRRSTTPGSRGTELTDRPGVTGEIWVRAAHLKDRYDSLWVTEQAAAAHPGWHRTGDVGTSTSRAGCGSRAARSTSSRTADGPVTPVGIEQRVQAAALGAVDGAAGGATRAAVVGVGPAGTQQVVVVLDRRRRAAGRAGAGRQRPARPPGRTSPPCWCRRRCRSTSGTTRRSTGSRSRAGRSELLSGKASPR